MSAVAFYAPMKPPTHPVASGDRAMARALIDALEYAGHTVDLACTLQTRDGQGDGAVQRTLIKAAEAKTHEIIERGKDAGWRAWVSYHCYYKAPDLIGPAVARALDLPYVLIEATRARKRLGGPWDLFARAAEAACDAASAICYLTQRDSEALRAYGPPDQVLVHLPPFLARKTLPPASDRSGPMLSVGMMRAGDKVASYALIAEALSKVKDNAWHLNIAGDGPARADVHALMAPFGDRVTFLGPLTAQQLETHYARASLFLWPGVNEAFGMAYLEAQAAGIPVIAQMRPGVGDVLYAGAHPTPDAGASALAARIDHLRASPQQQRHEAQAARAMIAEHHLIDAAARTLTRTLKQVTQ